MMTEKPKRPLSAYMLWLNQARESIKLENPGIKVTEVAKRGGELWRAMSDKSEWEQKAVKAKSDYTRALEEFEANGGVAEPRTATKRGKKAPSKKVTKTKKKKEESDEEGSEVEESD